ncbi:MAG: T9SS type A sorting domain-containing protein [Bacteroidales bacterium]|nr:T9SS type A sorting domain-containing protein [Bacteroidales bacterium]MCF8344044.1 T9SS type A sorting domain-containing protein [Bacteroidales bacterium]MCF8351890.1 T9SS type A sorting domain-containing protein [Bacteroidales bacterium]
MKKLLLFVLIAGFAVSAVAQNRTLAKRYGPINNNVAHEYEFTKNFSPVTSNNFTDGEDIIIGETRYDLQSNSSVQNRIWAYEDGTIGATWTLGFDDGTGFSDRGTGYNYYDGSDWGTIPTERVEPVKTGWPSYAPFGPNGEITCSHSSNNSIHFSWRDTKGEGDWNYFEFEGPEGAPGLLWPRMITSGENHDIIHLIALTTPVANGGTLYEGQDGALLYSRSVDGGETWEPENMIVDGLGSDYYARLSGDDYAWAKPQGNTLAFCYFSGYTDGIVLKSEDGGDSWDRIEFFEFPWGGNEPDIVETFFGAGDGYNAIALDNSGKAHVVFGRFPIKLEEGDFFTSYYYPNGLLYWNEDMDPLDTTQVAGGYAYYLPDNLQEDGYLCSKVYAPFEELGDEYPPGYQSSLSSMPQIYIDDMDQIFVSYSAIAAGFETDGKNFRHVYGIYSPDGGATWDTNSVTDYTGDVYHLFSECVFPSLSPTLYESDHLLKLVYQTSDQPGISIRHEEHGIIDNNIVYLPIPWLYTDIEEVEVNNISYVSQNYPNPASDRTMIQVNTKTRSDLSMTITNLVGKKVAEINKGAVDAGVHYFNIDVNDLPEGMYLYTVHSGQSKTTMKMVVR